MKDFNSNEFLGEDPNDPLIKAQMEEIWREERERNMKEGFDAIQKMGFHTWFTSFVFQTKYDTQLEAKQRVVEHMIEFFSQPHIEEYEKCAWLKNSYDEEMMRREEEREEDFFDWTSEVAGSRDF